MKKIIALILSLVSIVNATQISFTMDDPEVTESPLMSAVARNQKILEAFNRFKIKGALFVCGKRVDNPEGKNLLESWNKKGHVLANHSYSHHYLHSDKITLQEYQEDFLKVEPLLIGFKHFEKYYRFPYLKEGHTLEKREGMRAFLKQKNYRQGYVTIDASDWYIDQKLKERLKRDPEADIKPYRDFYLKHIWQRAQFYDDLASKVYGQKLKHTLLIHHSLLNALFLPDLMEMFKAKGWKLISAKKALKQKLFLKEPKILPAGESLLWSMAKEIGTFDERLRYPAEDSVYEDAEMKELGL